MGLMAALTFFAGFAVPPLWILTILFMYLEYRQDKAKERDRAAYYASPPIAKSNPGDCPNCGAINWSRGMLRYLPASGIRSFKFPMEGNAAVAYFSCNNCGARGRYGRSVVRRQDGWILLDRYMGGW
jgi:hypothetical protein